MNKRGYSPLLVITLIAGLITILVFTGLVDVAWLGGKPQITEVYKVRWGSLGCIEDDEPQRYIKWLDQQEIFNCGDVFVVDDCEFQMECQALMCLGNYQKCDLDGRNCRRGTSWTLLRGDIRDFPDIENGKSYKFNSNAGLHAYTKITQRYHMYRLWTEEGGGHWLTRSADCCLANQDEVEKYAVEYGDWDCLEKSGSKKYKNYIIDWIKTEGEIYSYQGEEVLCANNILYAIDYKKMADAKTYRFQGEQIKAVECCPYQTKYCGDDFKFKKDPEKRDCTYSYECENGGNPWAVGDSKAKKEQCINGECVEEEFAIECGSDARCRELYGEGWVCDLSYANFGKCIEGQINQPRCGDGICQTGETKENCPEDCEIECPEGTILVTREYKTDCTIGFPVYIGCTDVVDRRCEPIEGEFPWIWVVVVGGIIFVLFLFRNQILAIIKMIFGRFI